MCSHLRGAGPASDVIFLASLPVALVCPRTHGLASRQKALCGPGRRWRMYAAGSLRKQGPSVHGQTRLAGEPGAN